MSTISIQSTFIFGGQMNGSFSAAKKIEFITSLSSFAVHFWWPNEWFILSSFLAAKKIGFIMNLSSFAVHFRRPNEWFILSSFSAAITSGVVLTAFI